jgi:hypothetical protein
VFRVDEFVNEGSFGRISCVTELGLDGNTNIFIWDPAGCRERLTGEVPEFGNVLVVEGDDLEA